MIITVSLNPALDKTLVVEGLAVDGVNRVISNRSDPGGKSINVTKIVKVLGGETVATGIVGGKTGEFIQDKLTELGIEYDFVVRSALTRTNLKITDSLRRTTTEINEAGEPVTEELLQQVWEKLDSMARPGDTVVISGANPPGMADDVIASWVEKLKTKNVCTAIDTVGEPMCLAIKACPCIIKPNLAELSEIFGESLHYFRDIIAAARQIANSGVEMVVVSMGPEGAMLVTKDRVLRSPGLKVQLGSTVGSGDAMLGAMLYQLQQGASLKETLRWGVATGSANAMCSGSQTPTLEQIKSLLDAVQVEELI